MRPVHALFTLFLWVLALAQYASGHGILLEPPNRSSMWRFGYQTPINYDDNALNCGGFGDQWYNNNGKCGVCGDPYEQPEPRDNEVGGKYYSGIIPRMYESGQVIDVVVQLTKNHKGFFQFRLCPHNSFTTESSQKCLDEHLLEMADESGTKFQIPDDSPAAVTFTLSVKLPEKLKCMQCLFQWNWHTASNWGTCLNGTSGMGCGPQETFRGCADITILPSASGFG